MKKNNLILLGASFYILYLGFITETLFTFINPRYYIFIITCACICFLVSSLTLIRELKIKKILLEVFNYKKFFIVIIIFTFSILISSFLLLILFLIPFVKIQNDKTENIFKPKNLTFLLISLGFFAGIIMPEGIISSITAEQRIGNFNSLFENQAKTNPFITDTSSYSLGDWINLFNFNTNLNYYKGKSVKVSGFVFKPQRYQEEKIFVARFIIRCCAADAMPVGIRIINHESYDLKTDEWIELIGEFDVVNTDLGEEIVIVAKEISKIKQPIDPYIF